MKIYFFCSFLILSISNHVHAGQSASVEKKQKDEDTSAKTLKRFLKNALMDGNTQSVKYYLEKGASTDVLKEFVESNGLVKIVMEHDYNFLKIVLENGGISKIDEWDTGLGIAPLHEAVRQKNLSKVQLLLHKKADPNIGNAWGGLTPLYLAAMKGCADIVKELLAAGALADVQAAGKTPRDIATTDEVRALL